MEELNIQGILSFVFHLSLNPTVYPANISPHFHFLSGRGSPSPWSVGHVFPIFQPVGCRKCFCSPEKEDKAPWLVQPLLEADLLAKCCVRSQSELAQIVKQWPALQRWWWVFIFSYLSINYCWHLHCLGAHPHLPRAQISCFCFPFPFQQWHWLGAGGTRVAWKGSAPGTAWAEAPRKGAEHGAGCAPLPLHSFGLFKSPAGASPGPQRA